MSCKKKDKILAKLLAPEDIRVGMYVSIHSELGEYLPFSILCGKSQWSNPEIVRIRWLPSDFEVGPRIVISVCLPYILVKDQDGDLRTLDTRRYGLVRISDSYGREAFRKEARKRRKNRKRERERYKS